MIFQSKIVEANNWASVSYHSEFDHNIAVDPNKVLRLICLWPNGKRTWEKAVASTRRVAYSDHGHTYHATSDHLYAEIDYHGKKVLLPFKDLDVVGLEYDGELE